MVKQMTEYFIVMGLLSILSSTVVILNALHLINLEVAWVSAAFAASLISGFYFIMGLTNTINSVTI
jgi:hypothetical protein